MFGKFKQGLSLMAEGAKEAMDNGVDTVKNSMSNTASITLSDEDITKIVAGETIELRDTESNSIVRVSHIKAKEPSNEK